MPDAHPPILLLHGALGSATTLAPLAARLASAFTVHGMDFAGHGAATAPDGPLSIEHMAEEVAGYVVGHGLGPARLFGFSMGGYVALHLAATRPELVARVATLGTKLAWSPDVAERERTMLDPAVMRDKVPNFAAALEQRHTGMGWERLCRATAAMLDDLGARPRLSPETLATIGCAVRLMVGDRDATVSVGETYGAMRAIPAGELEVLPATPHPLERLDLGRVATSLTGFFRP